MHQSNDFSDQQSLYRDALDEADQRATRGLKLGIAIFLIFWFSLAIGQFVRITWGGLPFWFLFCIGSSFISTLFAVLYWIHQGKKYQKQLDIGSHCPIPKEQNK